MKARGGVGDVGRRLRFDRRVEGRFVASRRRRFGVARLPRTPGGCARSRSSSSSVSGLSQELGRRRKGRAAAGSSTGQQFPRFRRNRPASRRGFVPRAFPRSVNRAAVSALCLGHVVQVGGDPVVAVAAEPGVDVDGGPAASEAELGGHALWRDEVVDRRRVPRAVRPSSCCTIAIPTTEPMGHSLRPEVIPRRREDGVMAVELLGAAARDRESG